MFWEHIHKLHFPVVLNLEWPYVLVTELEAGICCCCYAEACNVSLSSLLND